MKTNTIHRRHLFAKDQESGFLFKFLITFSLFAFFIILPGKSFGQTTGYTLKAQVGDINAFAKVDSCAGEAARTFFIKFENNSTTDAYEIAYTLSVTKAITFPPITGTIVVDPGKNVEGNCSHLPLQGLRMPIELSLDKLSDLSINYTITKK